MFRFFLVLFSFLSFAFTFTSCGIYKKEIVYIHDDPTPDEEAPKPISIYIDEAPTGIVYYSPIQPSAQNGTNNTALF